MFRGLDGYFGKLYKLFKEVILILHYFIILHYKIEVLGKHYTGTQTATKQLEIS